MARPKNKRSLTIARHRTSISLEDEFWRALSEIAREERKSVAGLVGEIDKQRGEAGRTEARRATDDDRWGLRSNVAAGKVPYG
ncbi:MAG TPA: ribbon-helix-helix domain-containing protein, partial [Methyloceanibacter sp.]|nr:ribbon-helix-helix domain-containing protein [Methyloceanibacter sp.]